jgi:transcriptional regulator with XRE-family HTH domain
MNHLTPHDPADDDDVDASDPRVNHLRHTLARRLRTHRTHLHMTASALAQTAGISKAMLSKIESAERLPSVPVLLSLAEGLGVGLPDLFGGPAAAMEPEFVPGGAAAADIPDEFSAGISIWVMGAVELPGLRIRLMRLRAEPGSRLPQPVQFDGFWIDHVLSGEVVMSIDGQRYHLRPGDSLTYRGEVPHEMIDLPAGPVEMLAVEGWLTSAGMNPGRPAPGTTAHGLA